MAGIWTDAHRRWLLQDRLRRQWDVYSARIHGSLHRAWHSLPASDAERAGDGTGRRNRANSAPRGGGRVNMASLWFWIVAAMITAYVVLDGFDLGAGASYLAVAKTDDERRRVLGSIGPVWDGNEVWLIAAGGTLYFAFPQLYASSFSGFYLPLMIVLWLLMLRAIGLEFRSHLGETVWKQFLDAVFAISSILLAIFYGAALGNVVRGVPLGTDHYFFLPLFTNWRVGPNPGILDWYTVLSGVLALVALGAHGAHYVALKTDGELNTRCRRIASILSP